MTWWVLTIFFLWVDWSMLKSWVTSIRTYLFQWSLFTETLSKKKLPFSFNWVLLSGKILWTNDQIHKCHSEIGHAHITDWLIEPFVALSLMHNLWCKTILDKEIFHENNFVSWLNAAFSVCLWGKMFFWKCNVIHTFWQQLLARYCTSDQLNSGHLA